MNKYNFDVKKYSEQISQIILETLSLKKFSAKKFDQILKKYPKDGNQIFSRDQVIAYIDSQMTENREQIENSKFQLSDLLSLISEIKMKPMRTVSGVTTVTVLTKPFACPGLCVFCPNDVRMPKSYIATEPGAQRALMNRFSPYGQVFNRLQALKNIGHPTEKIELLVLGGTWSYYPKKYQIWFMYECFKAMNDFGSQLQASEDIKTIDIRDQLKTDYNDELRKTTGDKPYNQLIQTKEYKEYFKDKVVEEKDIKWEDLLLEEDINSKGKCRCVGLVLETRPDTITAKEVLDLRKLGATKIQLGIQTLNDEISRLNKRGETKQDTANAFRLLRAGGFKIHGHIMPNLYGSTPEIDLETYKELFDSVDYKPDELKIYPTSLIKNTELYTYWQEGKYTPYSTEQLVVIIAQSMSYTPEYCRLTRIIRDIPSTEIEHGNKTTNLRQVVEHKLAKEGLKNSNIRAREVKEKKVTFDELQLDIIEYETNGSTEYFLQYITEKREIAGFLRLSIPAEHQNEITPELNDCAIIREVHVYGPSLELSKDSDGQAQHLGLGTKLIEKAKEMAREKDFKKLAVISSIGTREYYDKRGFKLKEFYQIVGI